MEVERNWTREISFYNWFVLRVHDKLTVYFKCRVLLLSNKIGKVLFKHQITSCFNGELLRYFHSISC